MLSLSFFELFFALNIIAAGITFMLAMLVIANPQLRHRPDMQAYSIMMLGANLWSVSVALRTLADNLLLGKFLQALIILGTLLLVVSWFVLALMYSKVALTYRRMALLALVPVIGLLSLFTNEIHKLFFSRQIITQGQMSFPMMTNEVGIIGAIVLTFSALMYFGGFMLMIRISLSVFSVYRTRMRLILLAATLPLVAQLLLIFYGDLISNLDWTPIALVFSGLLLWRALINQGAIRSHFIDYAIVIQNLPSGILVFDEEDIVIATNLQATRILHMSREEFYGKTQSELLDQIPELASVIEVNFDTRRPIMINNRYIEVLPAALTDEYERPNDTNIALLGNVWVLRDVTERINTEQALRINEQRYRALFENSTDAVFIIDLDYKIQLANQRASDLLGVPIEDMIGQHSDQFILADETHDRQLRLQQLLSGARIPIYERTFIHRDGTHILCDVTLLLVRDSDGSPIQIQTIVRDISERRRNEDDIKARLEQLDILHQMDEEISSTLDLGIVQMIGLDAAVRLSHAEAGFIALVEDEKVVIKNFIGGYPDGALHAELRYDIGITGRVIVDQEPELILDVHNDPDYYADIADIEALMALPLVSQERLVGMLVLETSKPENFTEARYKLLQVLSTRIAVAVDNARLYDYVRDQLTELQNLYEELKQLEQVKTDMIRIASHDLKNPLSVINGYVELIRLDDDQLMEDHRGFLQEISVSVQRMQGILNDILSLERVNENGNQEALNLNHLVETAIKEYKSQALHNQQTLETDLCADPLTIYGSKPQIYEAISNLVGNALKYTPTGGKILVTLSYNDDQQALFKVIDNGYGIPQDRHSSLFQPFYRAKAEGTEHISGTGLGLHLVKNIIERHKGKIIFKSVYGKGSLFGFEMPLGDAPTSTTQTVPTAPHIV